MEVVISLASGEQVDYPAVDGGARLGESMVAPEVRERVGKEGRLKQESGANDAAEPKSSGVVSPAKSADE